MKCFVFICIPYFTRRLAYSMYVMLPLSVWLDRFKCHWIAHLAVVLFHGKVKLNTIDVPTQNTL